MNEIKKIASERLEEISNLTNLLGKKIYCTCVYKQPKIAECHVNAVTLFDGFEKFDKGEFSLAVSADKECWCGEIIRDDIGKVAFFNYEEAEEALEILDGIKKLQSSLEEYRGKHNESLWDEYMEIRKGYKGKGED